MALSLDWILQDPKRVSVFRQYLVDNDAEKIDVGRLDFVAEAAKVAESKSKSDLAQFKSKFVDGNDSGYFNDASLKSQLADEYRKFEESQSNLDRLVGVLRAAREDILVHKLKHCIPNDPAEVKRLKKLLSGKEESKKCIIS